MKAFRAGLCRILFATEVAGMGIDFPFVERVIQWRVGAHLNVTAVLQRLGQASRRPGTQGVFILYHTRRYVITRCSDPPLGVFRSDASRGSEDSNVREFIEATESWANGTLRMDPPEDPLDLPLIPFDSGENSYELQNPGTDRLVLGPDNEDSDMEDDPLSAHEEESDECLPSGWGSDSEEDDSDDDISVISANNDIRQSVQRAKRVSFPVSCRGIS